MLRWIEVSTLNKGVDDAGNSWKTVITQEWLGEKSLGFFAREIREKKNDEQVAVRQYDSAEEAEREEKKFNRFLGRKVRSL